MLRVVVLASGSKGNCTFVELDGVKLLVDAGISMRRINRGLSELGVAPEELDGILLTHEHEDHIKGLPVFCRHFPVPVYSRRATLEAIAGGLPPECLSPFARRQSFGRVLVESFNISHDAAEPTGFRIIGSRCCTVATDLGFVSGSVQEALEGATVLVLEANHDPELLRNGSYPWPLKRRIMSNYGHLSNNDAAWALARLKKKPQRVFLAHLSQENNRPELAEGTIRKILSGQGASLAEMELCLTSQDRMTGI